MWPREVIVPGEKIRGVYRDSKGRYGIAVVKIWNSVPHVHKKTTEAYLPLSGNLHRETQNHPLGAKHRERAGRGGSFFNAGMESIGS